MIDPAFDWDAYYERVEDEEDPDDLFRACIEVGWPEEDEAKKYVECGSTEVEDTPKALYRLLFLLQAKEPYEFRQMYKGCFASFFSADKRFLVAVHFFKYEIGLYFYCPKEAWKAEHGGVVVAGWPGADNGWHCTDEDGLAFFAMVTKAVNSVWDVYPGNDFKV